MASTNHSLVNDDKGLVKVDEKASTRGQRRRASREKTTRSSKKKNSVVDNSFPPFKEWAGVLLFVSIPGLMLTISKLTATPIPKPILYGVAALLGFFLVMRAYYSVELVLAVALIYFPFSKIFVIPIAPGLNGTNVFLLLVLAAGFFKAQRDRAPLINMIPGTKVVLFFAILSAYSAVTLTFLPGGFSYFKGGAWYSYKAWLDQFILYFVALSVIREREVAKRMILYIVIGSVLVVLFSVEEMIDKMGLSDLDKSRVEGPHLQPNNFGGFVAYTLLPVASLFLIYINRLQAWAMTPYMLLALKILITTFSRGAYLAMALGGLTTGYLRGKVFFASWGVLGLVAILMFPSVLPESVLSRLGTTGESVSTSDKKLDKSSQTRLIMWEAATEMATESPVFGKGFGAFPLLKSGYTDQYVHESDPHSMYFYLISQMGIPVLVLFLLFLLNMFEMGRKLAKNSDDQFIRAVGIGAAGMAVCMTIVNLFGSRFVNIDFTCYFFVYYVVVQVFHNEQLEKEKIEKKKKKKSRKLPQPVTTTGAKN